MCKINFTPFPFLETERFTLRQLTLEEDNEKFVLRSGKEVNRYLDRPVAKTIEDARQFIKKIKDSISKNELIFWVIAFKSQPKLIGTICLWYISEDETIAEIGFEILPNYQGKGIMQEAIPIIIQYGFQSMKLQSIEGEVDPNNVKSIKIMLRFKFSLKEKLENTAIYSIKNILKY